MRALFFFILACFVPQGVWGKTLLVSHPLVRALLHEAFPGEYKIQSLIQSGASLHDYTPQFRELEIYKKQNTLVIYLGDGSDEFIKRLAFKKESLYGIFSVQKLEQPKESHFWLSPKQLARAMGPLRDYLVQEKILNKTDADRTLFSFLEKLKALEEEYKKAFSDKKDRFLLVSDHGVFSALAENYEIPWIFLKQNPHDSLSAKDFKEFLDQLETKRSSEHLPIWLQDEAHHLPKELEQLVETGKLVRGPMVKPEGFNFDGKGFFDYLRDIHQSILTAQTSSQYHKAQNP